MSQTGRRVAVISFIFGFVLGGAAAALTAHMLNRGGTGSVTDAPQFLEAVIEDYRTPGADVWILTKTVSPGLEFTPSPAQVVVIHGFTDNESVCEQFREAANADGGRHDCYPAGEARRGPTHDFDLVPPQYRQPVFISIIWEEYVDPIFEGDSEFALMRQEENGLLDQVALIHGWVEDERMCELFRQVTNGQGEPFSCLPVGDLNRI